MLDTPLKCPKCGGDNVHHGEVQVFVRDGEDKPGRRILVTEGGTVSLDAASAGFAGRRNDLRISFTCERCPAISWLYIVQHKGDTIVKWADSPNATVYTSAAPSR